MELLATLDQHDLGWFSDTDRDISFHRQAARAVLQDSAGKLAVMYFAVTGSSKLPGGGLDDGEAIEDALHREILEETGFRITNLQPLGLIKEYRYIVGMEQTSYCFTAQTVDYVGTALTPEEAAQGMELRWYEGYDTAIQAIEASRVVEEGRDRIELEMMKLRDIVILRAASATS